MFYFVHDNGKDIVTRLFYYYIFKNAYTYPL